MTALRRRPAAAPAVRAPWGWAVAGVLIGQFLPGIPAFLGRFEYANVSIPIAILFIVMQRFYQESMSGSVKG